MIKRTTRVVLLVLTILSFLGSLTVSGISYFNSMEINPFSNEFTTRTYTDAEKEEYGNSTILSFTKDKEGMHLRYALGDGVQNPYAGVLFENHRWNLAKYDRVTINLQPENCNSFIVYLADYIPGFSDSADDLTWRVYEHDVEPRPGRHRYTLELNEFSTPAWWRAMFNRRFERLPEDRLMRVQQIQIQTHPLALAGDSGELTIKSLKFSHTPMQSAPFWIVTIVLLLVTFVVYRKRKTIPKAYEELEIEGRMREEDSAILTFIGNHYARPDMTLSLVSMETGVSQKQVRKVLSSHFDKSFKQYLTEIRLQEARRLLLETDRLIADVALYVGYKHATTFTRLFREHFGFSPREFRDRELKNG